MSFADEVRSALAEPKRVQCICCKFIASLPPGEQMAAKAVFNDEENSDQLLADKMEPYGFHAARSSVGRHRREHAGR